MYIWFIVQWQNPEQVTCYKNAVMTDNVIAAFKKDVRRCGGRVLAVVRPKCDLARELNAITGLCRVSD